MNLVNVYKKCALAYKPNNFIWRRYKSKSSSEYCLNLVKQYDYENFICTILLKNTSRSCAIAVRSFNVEIAKIAEQVSQNSIGLMRMKFWEDTIEKCFLKDLSKVPQHPVAFELFKAINKSKLSKRYLNTLILSRRDNLNLNHFNTLEDLEKYCEQSISNVYYLILEGCGVRNVNADHAASHLGKAQGIAQHLRCIPHSKQLNLIPIPQDILLKNNISHEDVIRSRSSENLTESVFQVATRAHQHLMKSKSLIEKVPIEARNALLPAIAVQDYLDKLEKIQYDIFHPSLKRRSWKFLPQLWLSSVRNKY